MQRLLSENEKIVGVDILNDFDLGEEGDHVRFINGCFTDPDIHDEILDNETVVYHLVSSTNPITSSKNPIWDVESNLIGTFKLLDGCIRNKIKRLVFMSSGGTVYGELTKPARETDPLLPVCSYGVVKATIENYLRIYRLTHGLDYVVLRVSNPFGPYQYGNRGQGLVATLIHNALTDRITDIVGNSIRDYLYIGDVVNALVLAGFSTIKDDSQRHINIGSGKERDTNEVVKTISEYFSVKILTKSDHDWLNSGVSYNALNIDLAKEVLDWFPKHDFNESIGYTIEWYRKLLNCSKSQQSL